jgi:hypothetical protein
MDLALDAGDDFLEFGARFHLLRVGVRPRNLHDLAESARVGLHEEDAVAQVDGLRDAVGDEEDGGLDAPPQLDEQRLHRIAGLGIERTERFVHQDDARLHDQRARDGHALSHSAGQLVRVLLLVPT